MRSLLAIVLSVAHLAGPWLCCCGPLAKAAAPPAAPASTPAPEYDSCRHCCPQEQAPPKPAPKPARTPTTPDRCPCCGVMVTALPADKPKLPTADALLVVVAVAPPQQSGVVSVSVAAVPGLRQVPHLTAADRLFSHHVLRC